MWGEVCEPDETKELSVKMQMYLEYEGNKTLAELENEFYTMLDKFVSENGLNYQIYEMYLQEV